jgi:hypothetical protein
MTNGDFFRTTQTTIKVNDYSWKVDKSVDTKG